MVIYQLELLSTLGAEEGQTTFYIVGTYMFNPGLNKGDEVIIPEWTVGDKTYEQLKTNVTGVRHEAYFPHSKLREEYGVQAAEKGLLIHRICLEPEDREVSVEIGETLNRMNRR
jgi:hypothetical protein